MTAEAQENPAVKADSGASALQIDDDSCAMLGMLYVDLLL